MNDTAMASYVVLVQDIEAILTTTLDDGLKVRAIEQLIRDAKS